MSEQIKSVFCALNGELAPTFVQNLTTALKGFGTDMQTWSEWVGLGEEIQKGAAPDLLVVDTLIPDFDPRQVTEAVIKCSKNPNFKFVVATPNLEEASLLFPEEQMPDAVLYTLYSPLQIEFVLKPLMFPILEERRQHPRVPVGIPVDFFHPEEERWVRASVFDLSRAGLFVESEILPEFRAYLQVGIYIPDGKPMARCDCRLIYVQKEGDRFKTDKDARPKGFGLRIKEISEIDQGRIDLFVNRLLRWTYPQKGK